MRTSIELPQRGCALSNCERKRDGSRSCWVKCSASVRPSSTGSPETSNAAPCRLMAVRICCAESWLRRIFAMTRNRQSPRLDEERGL
eukprot:6153941-Amphidinium_carterae.2